MEPINVTDLIDERPLSRLQIITIVLCGLVNLLDGIDTQSIGIAAPLIAGTLGMKVSQFGPVFSAALFGAMLGALAFGPIADRLGRRRMLALSSVLFGIFTLLTAHAQDYNTLIAWRFLAGIGLGGATPCFITLTSEYAPKRLRATLVSAMWSCFPLGGMLGGFMNSAILSHFGWQTMFHVGGALPFLVALLVLLLCPESLRFLMARDGDQRQVGRIVARMYPDLRPRLADAATLHFTAREEKLPGVSVAHLFRDGRAVGTLLLWVPFFVGFGTLSVSVLWTPTLLHLAGISPSAAAIVIGFYGLGGFVGNGIAGWLLDRFGILLVPIPGFLIGAAAIASMGQFADNAVIASFCGFFTSGMLGLGISSAIAMASAVYPTAVRSTGVGWAMGAGRLGQVFAPLLAGATLGLGWNAADILLMMAGFPLIGALFMLFLWLHIGRQSRRAGATQESLT